MVKKLDHVGIAVSNLDESLPVYENILGVKPVSIKAVPSQGVRAAFFEVGNGVVVELIEPLSPDSGVSRFLERHGQGIHHICFEVDDVDKALNEMLEKGFKLIDKQGKGGEAGKVGFIHPKSTKGVLIELVQHSTQGEELSR